MKKTGKNILKKGTHKKLCASLAFVMVFFVLQTFFLPATAFARSETDEATPIGTRTIRIGIFDSPSYYGTDENGALTGYGYSYLNAIEQVSRLRFDYVFGTREEHIENLNQGRIDLIDTIPYTAEYAEQFIYSAMPTLLSNGTLNVLASDTRYTPEDYMGFEGMRIGVLNGGVREEDFEQWARQQGFGYTKYTYTDGLSMFNALAYNEIDALVSDNIFFSENQRIIANFYPTLYYFITTPAKEDIMEEIDEASAILLDEQPQLRAHLSTEFLSGADNINALTQAERNYLEQSNDTPVRIAYTPDYAPFEHYNEETGEVDGLSVDVFETLMDTSGLTYEYVHAGSRSEAVDMMNRGEADALLSHSSIDNLSVNEDFRQSVPYLSIPLAVVGTEDDITQDSVFVLEEGHTALIDNYVDTYFPENEVLYHTSSQDCLDALALEDNIFTVENIFMAECMEQSGNYDSLSTIPTRLEESYSMLFAPHVDDILINILDKNIRNHSGQLGETHLLSHLSALSDQSPLTRWWTQFAPYILGIAAIVLLLAVIGLSYLLYRQRVLRKELWNSAYLDSLTGLPNLRYFKLEAKKLLAKNKNKKYLAVQVDFNQFSLLNDMYGQEECNGILQTMAEALSTIVKPESDIVARLRADNFLLLYAHENDMDVEDLHERDAGQVFAYMGNHVKHLLNYCIGRYQVPLGETDIDDICEKVNYAHRQAKKSVVSEVVDYEEAAKQRALRYRSLEERMETALTGEDFLVYMQPKYSLETGTVVGAETLVRWKDKDTNTLISPAEFIPLFEQNGFILRLDFYMFEKVCALLAQRIEDDLPIVPISVNFSRLHLQTDSFVQNIVSVANRYNVPRNYLEIELVESTAVDGEDTLEAVLKELHEAGFTLSIDDFGTGYSSLGLLKNLPVDVIKIDRSFFANNRSKIRARTVIANVLRMAKELNIRTVAEGVETQEHVNFLRGLGCESVQGFYFSRPVPLSEFNWGESRVILNSHEDNDMFDASELGDIDLGRSNLGEMMPVMVHRQLEFSLRTELERRYGERIAVEIMRSAGKISGHMFADGYLDLEADFDTFVATLKSSLLEQKIGDLVLESYDIESGQLVMAMVDDLTCSGVTDTRRTMCHYEEGFLAGVMERYKKVPYRALEVDCWANGAELCRFRITPSDLPFPI